MQIKEIIDKHKGIHAQEVTLAIPQLLNNVKKLSLLPLVGLFRPSSLGRTGAPRQSKNTNFLLLYDIRYIHNEFLAGVKPVQYMFSLEIEHGIIYLDTCAFKELMIFLLPPLKGWFIFAWRDLVTLNWREDIAC
ncbi:unnamed protein product [Lactuca saligna]|uniref:Uncharacterized protein n=1 Tax=Lactuca saligna TaxID=75948 RepID=A0AA35VCE4_LACSI|nr:unnamed protein product [Lactuca saligna]